MRKSLISYMLAPVVGLALGQLGCGELWEFTQDGTLGEGLVVNLDGLREGPANITLSFSVETQAGDPVTGLTTENFQILEDEEPLSQSEANTTSFPAPVSFTPYTLLMIDLSGSVTQSNLGAVVLAAKSFVQDLLRQGHLVGLYYFQTDVIKLLDFTSDEVAVTETLSKLSDFVVPGATTNLYGSFAAGLAALDAVKAAEGRPIASSLVVFTDGSDRADIVSLEVATELVEASEHAVFAVGLSTEELDNDTLGTLGADGYVQAGAPAQLTNAFVELSGAIQAQGQKFYVLTYCSSKRANVHEAEVIVTDPKTGQIGRASYNFTAQGFQDGCFEQVERFKLRYYDRDHDGRYSVPGPFQDCDDSSKASWVSCETCRDNDNDGAPGTGCDYNEDCNDGDPALYPTQGCAADMGFESGVIASVWDTGGDAGWFADCNTATRGRCAGRSGIIIPGEISWIRTQKQVQAGNLCFDFKAGLTANDNLEFLVDGVLAKQVGAFNTDTWLGLCTQVSEGLHEFEWRYTKAEGLPNDKNSFWIDNIVLP